MIVNEFIKLCLKNKVTANHKFISCRASSIVITERRKGREFIIDDALMRNTTFGDWCKRIIRLKAENCTMMVESWPNVMSLKVEDIAIDNQYIKL